MTNLAEKVYAFTNENVASYEKIFDFKGKDILSVIGSGDQYFAGILYEARSIELYDINPSAWIITLLKYYGFLILSYEEFIELFIVSRGTNERILAKILPYMPAKEANIITKLFMKKNGGLSSLIVYSPFSDFKENYQSGCIIPYLTPEKYYELQNKLRIQQLPKVYFKSLLDMPQVIGKKHYDIILTSNIYQWLEISPGISPKEYKEFLNQFNAEEIQAHYSWNPKAHNRQEFVNLDFDIVPVESVSPIKEEPIDEVYILRRTKK
ncbi:MAG: hypothetical protein K2M17_01500 [Bacilli bacterium]|nr:hypothetical protein [Bacilli bacterium]